MGTSVVEVLALEVNLRTTKLVRQPPGVENGRRATDIGIVKEVELGLELLCLDNTVILACEYLFVTQARRPERIPTAALISSMATLR